MCNIFVKCVEIVLNSYLGDSKMLTEIELCYIWISVVVSMKKKNERTGWKSQKWANSGYKKEISALMKRLIN